MYSRPLGLLSWNVRGLCSQARQAYVKRLVQEEQADIALLQETKTGDLALYMKNYDCFMSESARGSGGCMSLIHKKLQASNVCKSNCGRVVACKIAIQGENIGVVNVYAPNSMQERKGVWEFLKDLDWDIPMLFAGDWNFAAAEEFDLAEWKCWVETHDALDASEVGGCKDLSMPTWSNRHQQGNYLARRLDRVYFSDKGTWLNHDTEGKLLLCHTVSDHTPIKLRFRCKVLRRVDKGPPPFKFNTSFLRDEKFCLALKTAWLESGLNQDSPQARWDAGMEAITTLAKIRGKSRAKAHREDSKGLEYALKCTRLNAIQNPHDVFILQLLRTLEAAAGVHETRLAEAARVQTGLYWLKVGDSPNKTFFKALRAKKDAEYVSSLRRPDGTTTADEKEISQLFTGSLSAIVGSSMDTSGNYMEKLSQFLQPVTCTVTEEKRLLLGRPFTAHEIEHVVDTMKKEKAPGPDGMQVEFLQIMMSYASQDLCDLLNAWRNEGSIPERFNTGLIKLIPKGGDRLDTRNYRPLTMLNSVYKVMAKALALRIRSTVSQIVHPRQFGFVQGRSIHEAIFNAITAVDWASEQDEEYIMINMDLEKAYDRVGWEFLLAVIQKMGLGDSFSGMVSTLFQNAHAVVQVNGYASDKFRLARSVRQGCPLAPLLFALATDPLLRNLDLLIQRQTIHPLPLPNGQSFLAQMFADDNCNIIRYDAENIRALMQTYDQFCEVSGSRIAPHKTECLRLSYREDSGTLSQFGLTDIGAGNIIRYLGCPLGLGLTPHQCFSWIHERIEGKIKAKTHSRLSLTGRLLVLRHVLMALPVYVASLLHFSGTDWKKTEKCFRNYLWKYADKRSWCFASWEQICTPRDQGGWGIPKVVDKAQKLLSKWLLRLDSDQPWAHITRGKLKEAKIHGSSWEHTHWIDKLLCPGKLKVKNSLTLQKVISSWKVSLQGASWNPKRFDSSLSLSIWLCPAAMQDGNPGYLINPRKARALEKKGFAVFNDIWDAANQGWQVDNTRWDSLNTGEKELLTQVFGRIKPNWPSSQLPNQEPSLKEWKCSIRTMRDSPPKLWVQKIASAWSKEGCLISTKDCRYKMSKMWSATGSLRLNMLLWRVLCRKLPTRDITSKWGLNSPMCPRCLCRTESLKHALWDCYGVQPLWKRSSEMLVVCGFTERISWKQALLGARGRMNPAFYKVWQYIRAIIISKLWYDRNLLAHHKPSLNLDATQVKGWILEACSLAKGKKSIATQASIMSRKVSKL